VDRPIPLAWPLSAIANKIAAICRVFLLIQSCTAEKRGADYEIFSGYPLSVNGAAVVALARRGAKSNP
jgi:hypothetical protein